MNIDRIQIELQRLRAGGQAADLITQCERPIVLYRDVPTAGESFGLAHTADVIVPVPSGYPASMIDLAGLVAGSPFLGRVKGGGNNQGVLSADGRTWQLASYHPHQNGGGPPWDQNKHGFHTYLDHLISWLDRL
jgi:hypothetical protein